MTEEMYEKLLGTLRRQQQALELISDQLELQFLQQFIDRDNPDQLRLIERDEMRIRVLDKRRRLKLED